MHSEISLYDIGFNADKKKGGDPAAAAFIQYPTDADGQAVSDAGSIFTPGPMVDDRLMRLT